MDFDIPKEGLRHFYSAFGLWIARVEEKARNVTAVRRLYARRTDFAGDRVNAVEIKDGKVPLIDVHTGSRHHTQKSGILVCYRLSEESSQFRELSYLP